MGRREQYNRTLVQATLAAMLVVAICATVAVAAYEDDQSSQQSWQQQQPTQSHQQGSMQDQSSWQQQPGQRTGMAQARNQQLERQVASQIRQEGFGQEGQIMVLALGNRVVLLGTIPDQQQKDRIDQTVNQVSGVSQVDNRLHVSTGAGRQNDSQLQQRIQQQLQNQTSAGQDVQVQVRNGRVTLSGQVNNWQDVANVLESAFAAGAQNISSQLTTTSQGQSAMSQTDRGYYPPYGYTPGQEDQSQQWQGQQGYDQQRQGRMQQGRQQWDQQRSMQQQRGQQPSASDLALAQRIAMQLQQELGTSKTIHVMDPQAIYVHVSQGTVMLHGLVQDNNQKQQAEQIVQSIRGVQNVQNQLQIAGEGEEYQTFGYIPGQTDQSQRQGRSGQSQYSGSTRQGQTETMGTQSGQSGMSGMSDQSGAMSGQTDQSQWDTGSQSRTGDMSSQSGQSGTSTGQSSSTSGSQSAGSSQPQGFGQQSQSSQQPMTAADKQLSQQVKQQIQQKLPQANIQVSANQGTITLKGSVSDQTQKQQAEQVAKSISGVQNVQNQISTGEYPALGYIPGQDRQQRRQMGQRQGGANDKVLAHQIAMQLQQQLSTSQIIHVMDPDAIYVQVSQGTVTLHGSVDDQNQSNQAEQAISNIRGVQNVRNELTVGGQQQYGRQSGQQQQQPGRQSGNYPALGYIPGQEDQTAQQDTGTGISGDTQCIQMFKQGLTSQNLQSIAQNVYVTCNQGNMALYGYVKSNEEKDQLEKATKQVPGITKVDNNLIVKKEGWQQKSDAQIQEDVESQLWWSPYVDSDKIHVTVQNGVVTLTGQVDNWDAMRAAVKNAFDGGAKRVKSQLQYSRSGEPMGTTGQQSSRQSGSQRSGQPSGTDQGTTGGSSSTRESSGANSPSGGL